MPLLTLEEVAEELGFESVQSVRNLAEVGEFRILKVGHPSTPGRPRVDSRDLEEYIQRLRGGIPKTLRPGTTPIHKAAAMQEWAISLFHKKDATNDENTAASYILSLFAAFALARDKAERLRREEERRCRRAKSGFLRRAKELSTDDVPECLHEFVGKLIDVPVPTTGQTFIYFLLDGEEVVYIGQSVSLEGRLAQHVEQGKRFDRILAMPVPASKLNATERELIVRLCPSLNSSHVPADIIRERARRRAAAEGSA